MAFYYCLLFDVDGTLLDFNAAEDGALRDTLAHFSLPNTEDAVSQYHDINNALWAALEQGKVRQDKLVIQRFEKLLAAFGVQGNPVEINDYYLTQLSQRADTFPGAEEALEELAEVATLAVVSNGVEKVQAGRLEKSGLGRFFDGVFVSGRVGATKPARKIFDTALNTLGIENRKKVLMIGDSLKADIAGARERVSTPAGATSAARFCPRALRSRPTRSRDMRNCFALSWKRRSLQMPEVKKNAISFKSSNGTDTVAGYYYTCPGMEPRCILQISHGMCEYIGRYDDFAGYMAQKGYVVCGNDHLGHGATSSGPNGTDGYFAEKDGRKFVLQDLHEMNRLAREAYPGLPVILLGHSMGSFFARMYAVLYPETLHALVLSGTGGPNPLAGVGLALTEAIGRVKGRKHRSKFLNNMAFGQYLKRVDSPDTPYDWISRDKEVVARYAQDAKCTFIFTASAFHELMAILRAVNRPQWAQKVDKRLPVALFAGDADPVGDYGRGVESVYRALKDAGVKDVFLKLYPGARHEILNETNRAEVYADILAWCDAHQA